MIFPKKTPPTSINCYVSGFEALNTPDAEGMIADWHPKLYWYSDIENETIKLFSNNILGSNGIEKRKILYSDKEVYIANYPRAITDLVFTMDDLRISSLSGFINDFAFDTNQEAEVFSYLLKINKQKNITWFIKRELTRLYFNQKGA